MVGQIFRKDQAKLVRSLEEGHFMFVSGDDGIDECGARRSLLCRHVWHVPPVQV